MTEAAWKAAQWTKERENRAEKRAARRREDGAGLEAPGNGRKTTAEDKERLKEKKGE